jgi:hypothetical protein
MCNDGAQQHHHVSTAPICDVGAEHVSRRDELTRTHTTSLPATSASTMLIAPARGGRTRQTTCPKPTRASPPPRDSSSAARPSTSSGRDMRVCTRLSKTCVEVCKRAPSFACRISRDFTGLAERGDSIFGAAAYEGSLGQVKAHRDKWARLRRRLTAPPPLPPPPPRCTTTAALQGIPPPLPPVEQCWEPCLNRVVAAARHQVVAGGSPKTQMVYHRVLQPCRLSATVPQLLGERQREK